MSNFDGKTAVISGGAEGIGLSIAKAVGKRGMNVVLGDIDEAQLAIAESTLNELGINVLGVQLDVSDLSSWKNMADKAVEHFGKVHMLVNNAGVSGVPGPIEKTNHKEWDWVLDVNLKGVLYGAEVCVPYMKEHSEGGWLINVASMAGMAGIPYANSYTATKVAVVGLSESWLPELARSDIKVSVLCPAFVQTRIHLSSRNKQAEYKNDRKSKPSDPSKNVAKEFVENGIPVEIVGERVVEALGQGEFYIFTHPNHRKVLQERAEAIDAAFERAAESPLLQDILDQEVPSFG